MSIRVNNADMVSLLSGWDAEKPLADLSLAEWDEALARNVRTAFLATRAFLPRMQDAGYGRIANVSFLASPAASFITGRLIVVDGGNSIAEDESG